MIKETKMKKLCVIATIMLMCTSALADVAITGLVGEDEVITRLGFERGAFEAGIQINGLMEDTGSRLDDYEWDHGLYGAYGQYSLGPAYAGLFGTYDFDTTDDKGLWGGMIGLKAVLVPRLTIVGEVQYRVHSGVLRDAWGQDDIKGFVGLAWRF